MLKHTLVLGASLKPNRYSNVAIKRLREHDHPVTAVGLLEGAVQDVSIITFESAFAKAEDHKNKYHTITLYLGAKNQVAYYDYIISLNPERVIFNPGTENPALYRLLEENNIAYEASCTLVLLATNQY